MEVLGGEVDLEVDGFEVTLEPEFTWVLVKVKGLGGAGARIGLLTSSLLYTSDDFAIWEESQQFWNTLP